jgi:glycosyltransferase involved in cell wall biosynthesis
MSEFEPELVSLVEPVEHAGTRLLSFPAGRHARRLSAPARVTACLPVFNGGPALDRCLETMRVQTSTEFHLIIVDNCSTDDTFARCAAFAHRRPHVTLYQNAENVGRIPNWNRCLDLAAGEFVKFVMVNDLFAPACIEHLARGMDACPGASMAASSVSIADAQGRVSVVSIFDQPTVVPGRAALEWGLTRGNIAHGPSGQMLRRSVLEEHGVRFDESFSWAADYELTMRLFLHGDLVYLPDRLHVLDLSRQRFHNDTASLVQFRDECRIATGALTGYGIEVGPDLRRAACGRIERLYAEALAGGGNRAELDAVRRAVLAQLASERRRITYLATVDWQDEAAWRGVVGAYVGEFAQGEPVSLVLRAALPPGATVQDAFQGVVSLLGELGRDPETIPDLALEDAAGPQGATRPDLVLAPSDPPAELRRAMRAAA